MLDFAPAKPVKQTRNVANTREKMENPFTAVIAEIALQMDADGPVARSYVREYEEDGKKTALNRDRRQLSEAGHDNDPMVTVRWNVEDIKEPLKGRKTFDPTKEGDYSVSETSSLDGPLPASSAYC